MNLNNEKDLRLTLGRIMDVCDFSYQKYKAAKESEMLYEDPVEMRLTRKEENEIEHLYLNNRQDDSNQNSEYGPDDDLDAELNNKEMLFKSDMNSMTRPFSSENINIKKTTTRYMLKAKDKK
jgi:hypothetical protein